MQAATTAAPSGLAASGSSSFLSPEQQKALQEAIAAKQAGEHCVMCTTALQQRCRADRAPPGALATSDALSARRGAMGAAMGTAMRPATLVCVCVRAEREAAAKHQHKALAAAQSDRKSRNSKGTGGAKKGGGGGKFTWGSILTNGARLACKGTTRGCGGAFCFRRSCFATRRARAQRQRAASGATDTRREATACTCSAAAGRCCLGRHAPSRAGPTRRPCHPQAEHSKWMQGCQCGCAGDKAERVLDRNDPNYDSDEEREVVLQSQNQQLKEHVQSYKQTVRVQLQACCTSSSSPAGLRSCAADLGGAALPPRPQVAEIVSEYFSSGDIADVAESLEDLGVPVRARGDRGDRGGRRAQGRGAPAARRRIQ